MSRENKWTVIIVHTGNIAHMKLIFLVPGDKETLNP